MDAKGQLLTPKFLPKDLVEMVVQMVLEGFVFNRRMLEVLTPLECHIVVLVPAVEDARNKKYPNWPNYPAVPFPIFEKSVGDKKLWGHDFENIARCKAQQLWRGQNADGNTDSMPHLLFPDDTPFWGGVKRHGLVVTCSGFKPYFDQMISGMIADGLKAFGRYRFEVGDDKRDGLDFLS